MFFGFLLFFFVCGYLQQWWHPDFSKIPKQFPQAVTLKHQVDDSANLKIPCAKYLWYITPK